MGFEARRFRDTKSDLEKGSAARKRILTVALCQRRGAWGGGVVASLSVLQFFLCPRAVRGPAQAVVDPIHSLGPGVLFSLEKGLARVAIFEPSEGDV